MTEQNDKKLNVKSFELDHRLVSAPYIRVADRTDLGGGVEIIKYDLRFCQPNQDHLDTKALHSVEHMMANFMRNYTISSSVLPQWAAVPASTPSLMAWNKTSCCAR